MTKQNLTNTWKNLIAKSFENLNNKKFTTKWLDFYEEYFQYFSKSSFSLEEMVDKIFILTKEKVFEKPIFLPFGLVAETLLNKGIKDICENAVFCDNSKFDTQINGLTIINPNIINSLDFSHIVITSTTYCDNLIKQLINLGVKKEKIITPNSLQYFKSINYEKSEEIAKIINSSPKDSIIFSCISFPWANIDRFKLLKKQFPEKKIFLISVSHYLFNGPEIAKLDPVFDNVFNVNLSTMLNILSLLKSELTMMTSGSPFSTPMHLIQNRLFKGKHIHEVYDCVDEMVFAKKFPKYHHHRVVENELGTKIWDFDYECKKMFFNTVDKLMFRDSPKIVQKLIDEFDVEKPVLHMLPFETSRKVIESNKYSGLHFVHCGHIIVPSNMENEETWKDCGVQDTLFKIVPEVIKQGIHFYLFNPSDKTGLLIQEFSKNLNEDEKRSLHYEKPLFGKDFDSAMNKCHFGWMVYDFRRYSEKEMPSHHLTLSTKLFSYIQAEIPVIISKEYKYMCEICDKYNIGIKVDTYEISSIKNKIAKVNYMQLVSNVKNAKKDLGLEKNISRFFNFL